MKYPTDQKTREALIAYRTEFDLTNKKLGALLGQTETFICKYLNDNLDRNPKNFAEESADILKALRKRRELADEIFDTNVTKEMHGRINFIRETCDLGLLYGPAGIGKTSGSLLYVERNPSCIYVPLNASTRTAAQVEGAVFRSIENSQAKGNEPRRGFMINRLAGSQRVIIMDNAQRLNSDGLNWVFDFYDETDCPIVLIGNPEVLAKIKKVDQRSSRIGICPLSGLSLATKNIADVAERVAIQFSDIKTAKAIADLCAIVAQKDGHLRSVRKQVVLTQALRRLQPKQFADDPRKAFRAAHNELVRDYTLPA